MGKAKHGISTLLKVLYGLLFALSLGIIITFYFDKSSSSQVSYEEGLRKQIEALAIQINIDDVEHLINSNSDTPNTDIFSSDAYITLSSKIAATQKILGVKSSEIRLLYKSEDQTLRTIVCSDELYKYGEIYRHRKGLFNDDMNGLNLFSARVNEDLVKLFLIKPITNANQKTIAHLLISAPESPYWAKMNKSMIKNISILLIIYFVLGIFFMRSLKNNREFFSLELTKTKNIKEQLEINNKELTMLSLVAKSSKDLILITDSRGVIIWINDSYKNKNNYSKTELEHFIGQSLFNVSKNKQITNIIKNANSFMEEFTYETKSLDNGGNEFWAETLVNPIVNNGALSQIIFIDRDITELMRLKDQKSVDQSQSTPNLTKIINQ